MSKSGKKKSQVEGMSIGRLMRVIGRFMKGQRYLFVMAGLMLTFEAMTAALAPQLLAYVIDFVDGRLNQIAGLPVDPPRTPLDVLQINPIFNRDIDTIAIITIGIILLTMVNSFGDSMAEIYLAKGGRSLGYNLRVSLYAHLQKLSLAFHDQRRTGDVLTRVTSDVAALEDFVISSLSDFVGSVLLIGFFLIFMVLRNWQVAVVAAIIIPIMSLLSNYFTQRIKAASKKRRTSEGELASAAQEMLASIRVIQTYGLGSYEQAMFAAQSQKAMDAALETAAYQARFSWFVSVLGAFAQAAVIWLTVALIFNQPISAAQVGVLAVYTKYINDMFKPTKRIIQEWNTFGKLYASIERIGDLLDIQPSVQDAPGAVEAPPFNGRLEFRNVFFTYPTMVKEEDGGEFKPRAALKNLNFTIEPGQVVAVVGHTGAGKSTIAQLIPRLYDPNEGQILIDGHDLREFTLDTLRAQISMVLQESILFSGSVVENIAYGRPDATGAEIIAAATQANAHEFIEKLPEGYYTMLGERGANLSGGQRQRLAIARAFIRNTSILIMDEPTTGLDAESTELVLRALRKLMKGKTTIIISHDLNLIRDADKIIVIKAGEIEQMGTHDELIRAGGLYANLYMKQYGQVEAAPDPALPSGALRSHVGKMMNQIFRQGSGGQAGYDLPRNEHFLRRLPSLAEAFDAERMKDILSATLFAPNNPGYTLVRCAPGKAIYLADDTCSLEYALEILDHANGQMIVSLLNARLFPELGDCRAYVRKFLAPLAKQLVGRPELAPFAKLTAVIERLRMSVAVFPIDGDLPMLIGATDPKRMIRILNQTYPDALSGEFNIQTIRMELAHYGRYQRCVLRILMEGEKTDNHKPHTAMVYGKVAADVQGGLTQQVISALRERVNQPNTYYKFRIPLSYGYIPDLNLVLMEGIPGDPVIKRLLKHWPNGSSSSENGGKTKDLNLEEAIGICARIAATMHNSGIRLGRRHSLENEISLVEEEIQLMRSVFPELGEQMKNWLVETLEFAQTTHPMPLALCHGDFTYTQLIFDGKESGLVDFDTACQAEPALDLGQFLAYQRLSLQKDHNPQSPMTPEVIEQLSEHFLNTYITTCQMSGTEEAQLRSRTMVYELITLIRLGLHSWQKLKGERLAVSLQLIEERLACLTKVK